MPQFEVTVKWGKEKFPKVGINTDENPEVFRAQLFALTKWGQISIKNLFINVKIWIQMTLKFVIVCRQSAKKFWRKAAP